MTAFYKKCQNNRCCDSERKIAKSISQTEITTMKSTRGNSDFKSARGGSNTSSNMDRLNKICESTASKISNSKLSNRIINRIKATEKNPYSESDDSDDDYRNKGNIKMTKEFQDFRKKMFENNKYKRN